MEESEHDSLPCPFGGVKGRLQLIGMAAVTVTVTQGIVVRTRGGSAGRPEGPRGAAGGAAGGARHDNKSRQPATVRSGG